MIADRQTHTHTDTLITILRSPIGGRSNNYGSILLLCFFGFRGIDDVNCFQGLDDVSATSGYNKANQRFRLPAFGFLIVFSSNHSD